jgi:hypothetical protein
MGLASIADHKLAGILSVGTIFNASIRIGQKRANSRMNAVSHPQAKDALRILQVKKDVAAGNKEGLGL